MFKLFKRKPKEEVVTKYDNISIAVAIFVKRRIGTEFTAQELRNFVAKHTYASAPASADRILRKLRKQNIINYAVVSRKRSLYRAMPLNEV